MVQVFINGADGLAGYDKMPIALASGVKNLVGEAWPLCATFIGGIGTSVAGSNTVSNMMFALFQYDVGVKIGVDPAWIVALQAVGGAAGNTICVHNVVAASAVVGLIGKEGLVIRKTLPGLHLLCFATGSDRLFYRMVAIQRGGQHRYCNSRDDRGEQLLRWPSHGPFQNWLTISKTSRTTETI